MDHYGMAIIFVGNLRVTEKKDKRMNCDTYRFSLSSLRGGSRQKNQVNL